MNPSGTPIQYADRQMFVDTLSHLVHACNFSGSAIPFEITDLITRPYGTRTPDRELINAQLREAIKDDPWSWKVFCLKRNQYLTDAHRGSELERGIVLQIVAYASACAGSMPWPDFDRVRLELGAERFPKPIDPAIAHRARTNLVDYRESVASETDLSRALETLAALQRNAPARERGDGSRLAWLTVVETAIERLAELAMKQTLAAEQMIAVLNTLLAIEEPIRDSDRVSVSWRAATEIIIRELRTLFEARDPNHPMLRAQHERISIEIRGEHRNTETLRAAAIMLERWYRTLGDPIH